MNPHDVDELLRDALGEAPPTDQVARLADYWRRTSRADRLRVRIWQASAIAATIAVLASGAMWLHWQQSAAPNPTGAGDIATAPQRVPQRAPQPVAPLPPPAPQTLVQRDAAPPSAESSSVESLSMGRAPTSMERMMFAAVAKPPNRPTDRRGRRINAGDVDGAIAALIAQPDADAFQTAVSHGLRPQAEAVLISRLQQTSEGERLAVIKLLGAGGTPASVAPLVQVAERVEWRAAALAAVEQIVGVDGLAAVVRQTRSPGVRRALLSRMLVTPSDATLRDYLSFVSDEAYSGDAMSAALAAPALPVSRLLRMLDSQEKSLRLSAAIVLGRVDGPEIAAALINKLSRPERGPSEAWVALLACRDEQAARFLARASQQPRLLGQVNNARMFWARFTP